LVSCWVLAESLAPGPAQAREPERLARERPEAPAVEPASRSREPAACFGAVGR